MNKRLRFFLLPLSVLPALLSCGTPPQETAAEPLATSQAQALLDGSPGATAVLAFLNDYSTTLAVLDYEVPLNSLAAQNLIAWRYGPDGVLGTGDDRRFHTLAQVHAVPYVGPGAVADLLWYARGTGRVEMALDAPVGFFDGFELNLAESRRILDAANVHNANMLEHGFGIPLPVVQNIIAARPIEHMVELSRISGVDNAVMQRFKLMTDQAPEGEPCTGANTCRPGLTCTGIPGDGASLYGRCRNTASIPGEGASCSVLRPCQAGLVCAGSASGSPQGNCRPAWMAAEFSHEAELALPSSSTPVESRLAVVGLATVPEDLTVELDLVHASPHRLVLTLVDPGGDTALLWDGPNEGTPPARISVTRGISRDSSVNGRWTLRVTNPSGTGSGTLRSWTLKLTSRWD